MIKKIYISYYILGLVLLIYTAMTVSSHVLKSTCWYILNRDDIVNLFFLLHPATPSCQCAGHNIYKLSLLALEEQQHREDVCFGGEGGLGGSVVSLTLIARYFFLVYVSRSGSRKKVRAEKSSNRRKSRTFFLQIFFGSYRSRGATTMADHSF